MSTLSCPRSFRLAFLGVDRIVFPMFYPFIPLIVECAFNMPVLYRSSRPLPYLPTVQQRVFPVMATHLFSCTTSTRHCVQLPVFQPSWLFTSRSLLHASGSLYTSYLTICNMHTHARILCTPPIKMHTVIARPCMGTNSPDLQLLCTSVVLVLRFAPQIGRVPYQSFLCPVVRMA